MLGTLYSPSEALSIGLVDELAPDADAAEEACRAVLQKFLANDADAVGESKASLRYDIHFFFPRRDFWLIVQKQTNKEKKKVTLM